MATKSPFKKLLVMLIMLVALFGLLLEITSSKSLSDQPTATATPHITPAVYLINALDIIQQNALNADQISDWAAYRKQIFMQISGAKTTADTYEAIRAVLYRLNDHHSHLLTPDTLPTESAAPFVPPVVKRLPDNLGYIQLPPVFAQKDLDPYVETVYTGLKQIAQPPLCGWVLDLRVDQGGNMYPMLAAVGPLLGNGTFGTFIDRKGNKSAWFYRDGAVGEGDLIVSQAKPPDLGMDYSIAPVALLTSSLTASSGEAIVVSFSGRDNTRRFGSPTAGLTTGNKIYTLSDGAILVLTEVKDADRTGNVFVGSISPDVSISVDSSPKEDAVLEAAVDWLKDQCHL